MTQDDELTATTIDEIATELSTLLSIHARPGRTMAFALVLTENGKGAGKVVSVGDNAEEIAEGLEFLAHQIRGGLEREA